MSIEESLKKIIVEEKKTQTQITKIFTVGLTDENLIDALRKYISFTTNKIRNNANLKPYDHLIIKLAPYLRFNEQMQAKFIGIPREELVTLLQEQSEDLKYLFAQTNAQEALPKVLEIKDTHFNSFLNTHEIKNIFKVKEVKKFIKGAETIFTIPDIGFIGLFIEEGQKALAYAKIAGDYRHDCLMYFYEKGIEISDNPKLIELKGMQKYHEQTGEKDLNRMIDQANKFRKMIEEWKTKKDIPKARETLFKLLQQYHPELVYVENKNTENQNKEEKKEEKKKEEEKYMFSDILALLEDPNGEKK